MNPLPDSPIAMRDRGLERLRKLTWACVAGAAGLAAVLSVVAAWSNPGHQSATSGSAGPALIGSDSQDQSQNQSSLGGFFGSGGGSPVAVSGGS
jgi:hypothetical protein